VSRTEKLVSADDFCSGTLLRHFLRQQPIACQAVTRRRGATGSKYYATKASPFSCDCTTIPKNPVNSPTLDFGEPVVQPEFGDATTTLCSKRFESPYFIRSPIL